MEAGSLRECSAPMILERTLAEGIQEDPSIASDQAKKDLSYAALSRGERVVQNLTILAFTQGQMFIWNGFTIQLSENLKQVLRFVDICDLIPFNISMLCFRSMQARFKMYCILPLHFACEASY